jgi:RES domain-containing protein
MGAPPANVSSAGRLNPKGISFFYSALEESTAVAEVRPWTMARLSVANFLTSEPIEVLDLTGARADIDLLPSVRFAAYMISRPVHRDDPFAYVGTQHLAQSLKSSGVKGLLYNSLLKPGGTNLALFAEGGLTGVSVALHEVTSVTYRTSRVEIREA